MPKKQPLRMCVACREMKEKKDLLRIVKTKEGEIFVDQTFKANGRGTYICKSKECMQKAQKSKALQRAFKQNVGQEIYEEIGRFILANEQ